MEEFKLQPKTGFNRFAPQPISRIITLPDELKNDNAPDIDFHIVVSGNQATITSDISGYENMRRLQYVTRTLAYETPLWVDKLGARNVNPDIGIIIGRWMTKNKTKLQTQTRKTKIDTFTFDKVDATLQKEILMAEKDTFLKEAKIVIPKEFNIPKYVNVPKESDIPKDANIPKESGIPKDVNIPEEFNIPRE